MQNINTQLTTQLVVYMKLLYMVVVSLAPTLLMAAISLKSIHIIFFVSEIEGLIFIIINLFHLN